MTGILAKVLPDKGDPSALEAQGVTFQVLVAEDAILDAQIQGEDPRNDLVYIPGFSKVLRSESCSEWPLVWFPILGESRVHQLEMILNEVIPPNAEICPIVPHPSRDPRRAENLLVEYRQALFDRMETPSSSILYAHEAQPFEAYRQLLRAMKRYCNSMRVLGGCRLIVTPLASKLITVGAGLACFEMQPSDPNANFGVGIPYAQPTRYVASSTALRATKPEVCSLVLTGPAYASGSE